MSDISPPAAGRNAFDNSFLHCCVSGCHRGMYAETAMRRYGTTNIWLICAFHWRRLTRAEKQVIARLNRLQKKYGSLGSRYRRIVRALIRRAGLP